MLDTVIKNYLTEVKGKPFFYNARDDEYNSTLDELKQEGLQVIRLSDFCKKPDKFPDIGEIVDSFRTADVDYKTNKYVLVGLGEYLALRGEAEALKVLRELKGTTLGNARVVLLLRFVGRMVDEIANEDLRFKSQSRVRICAQGNVDISIVNVKIEQSIGLTHNNGIQFLLHQLEDGKSGKLYVKTNLQLSNSWLPMEIIEDSYSALKILVSEFSLPRSLGEEEQWNKFLADLSKKDYSILQLFESFDFQATNSNEVIENTFGLEYRNWLYFIYLKLNIEKISNAYLKFVIDKVNDFKDLRREILNAIISVKHTDRNFKTLYDARKRLLKDTRDEDVAEFIRQNDIYPEESIYKLTDNTLLERQTIIRWISEHGVIKELEHIYPALYFYLKKYNFICGKNSDKFTEYFENYKRQKIANRLDDGFENYARESASLYAGLQTRANAMMSMGDKKSCYLYWIDALGVEYLSYIQELAQKKGLSIHIEIARAAVPTITGINRDFYDEWTDEKYKESRLDDVKHNEVGGFDYRNCQLPIHLATELDIIEDTFNRIARELASHNYKKFIIASDHGASRLAVLGQHSEKYETDTKGEHSGRCCKYFNDYDLSNSVAENGYIILTDYGRFKGSREANVEVHGGCTLEETVVPIITLSLKNQTDVKIIVMKPEGLVVDKKNGVQVSIYISDVESPKSIRMEIKGKSYEGKQKDETHYTFALTDIKRSGEYDASIFDGSNLIGQKKLRIKGTVGSAKSDFDDLF